jgi:hypothetical protein
LVGLGLGSSLQSSCLGFLIIKLKIAGTSVPAFSLSTVQIDIKERVILSQYYRCEWITPFLSLEFFWMMVFVLLTFSRVENPLSHTDGLRSDFTKFIRVDVVKAVFQGHLS